MGGSGLPGPLVRIVRSRTLSLGLVLLGATAIAAGGMGEAATVRVTEAVDANWRGAYDILVRPATSRLGLESTGGLVEPNFLGFSGTGGISFQQLDAIRAIPDVELAAPMSVVGLLANTLRPHQLALLWLAGFSGLSLTLVLLGLDLADRRREFFVLRAVGWTSRSRRALVLAERAGLGLLAAVLASILAWLMAGPILGTNGALPAALAVGCAGSVVLWGAGWRLPDESPG